MSRRESLEIYTLPLSRPNRLSGRRYSQSGSSPRPNRRLPMYLIKPPIIGLERLYWQRFLTPFALNAACVNGVICLFRGYRRSPPERRRRPSPRYILPLRLRQQPVALAVLHRKPRNVSLGVIPAHIYDGAVVPTPALIARPVSAAPAICRASVPFGKCHSKTAHNKRLCNLHIVLWAFSSVPFWLR